jgi:beta-galactosidase beta subunit
MGWRAESLCRALDTPYQDGPDVGFWGDRPISYVNVQAGQFTIFYPADPHAPMSGHERFLKPVVKIAVDWK